MKASSTSTKTFSRRGFLRTTLNVVPINRKNIQEISLRSQTTTTRKRKSFERKNLICDNSFEIYICICCGYVQYVCLALRNEREEKRAIVKIK